MAITTALASVLGPAADVEIRDVLLHGGGGVGAPKGEVSAVAAVVLDGVRRVASAWKPLLAGMYSCSITGVFVHGSPYVDFFDSSGASRNCELGDLLVVVDETRNGAVHDRRANLIQAKITRPPGTFKLRAKEQVQLSLYKNWHTFTFSSSSFSNAPRDFNAVGTPGSVADSGRYGGINLVSRPRLWGQTIPAAAMSSANTPELGSFIAEMATGGPAGRPATAGGTDDWSRTIDELLLVSGPQPSSFGVGLSPTKGRGATVVAFLQHPSGILTPYVWPNRPAFAVIARDPPPPSHDDDRPPKDAISVIHVSFERAG